jgi:hypothetical protein
MQPPGVAPEGVCQPLDGGCTRIGEFRTVEKDCCPGVDVSQTGRCCLADDTPCRDSASCCGICVNGFCA